MLLLSIKPIIAQPHVGEKCAVGHEFDDINSRNEPETLVIASSSCEARAWNQNELWSGSAMR